MGLSSTLDDSTQVTKIDNTGDSSDSPSTSASKIDPVKQFKRSIFAPFWHNPNLNSQSGVKDHVKHAFHTLTGKHSDMLKKPFTENAFIGLMLQLLKLNDLKDHGQTKETFFSLFEFLKLPLLKAKRKIVKEEEETSHKTEKHDLYNSQTDEWQPPLNKEDPKNEAEKEFGYVIDPNSCPVKDVIREGGDIKQLENHLGLIMNPLEAAALLCVQYSQHLRSKGKVKTSDAYFEHNNTSPFLEFWTNVANRSSKNKIRELDDVVEKFYRTAETIFYFTVRLWVEIAATITAPLWQLAQVIIAATVLAVTFPIWYPISKVYYSQDKQESENSSSEDLSSSSEAEVDVESEDTEDYTSSSSLS